MGSYAYAVMLGQGKADELRRFVKDYTVGHKDEHEDYLRRYHLIKEHGWLQQTPMGDMAIIYIEATDDFLEENRKFAASTHPFDVWFKQTIGPILGQDLNQPFPRDFVEVLYETHDIPPTGRERPFAIASPVLPGKTEAGLKMTAEAMGPRREELREAHRRFGSTVENTYLEHTPQGDLSIYYAEAENPEMGMQAFGQSRDPFDMWWKERLLDVTGIDYNQPMPGSMPELLMSTTMQPMGAMR